MEPYAGKSNEVSNKSKDIYSSVELADESWHKFKLTIVGTMKLNRKHIPRLLKIGGNRELYSSIFRFSKATAPTTLLSYSHKPKNSYLYLCSTSNNWQF